MLDQVCQLARNAGDAIMQVYDGTKPMDVVSKADNSPVTAADIAAHTVIMDGLRTLTPDIPVLSEEDPPGWEVRQHWQRYWLVDPLDGTKEFIKRNGEFTVNIALIDHGKPIFRCGVCAGNERNVQRGRRQGLERRVRCAQADSGPRCAPAAGGYQPFPCRCGAERVSATAWRTSDHVHRLFAEILPGGGRTGAAVPRFGPTNIWDTAAGHAVAAAAGAHVHDWQGKPLDYTPRESFLNPGFRVSIY
ncbi:cysQ protein [Escherichia coli]|uniref:3'(2'),5-bisphosphonucleoside 3'(2')-phosphohydrolase n=1 Tax=Escherichia coli TaxID=562 RepID=A0A2X3K6Z5_ECOLX|nr:cysQ protein [Escherichia coli]